MVLEQAFYQNKIYPYPPLRTGSYDSVLKRAVATNRIIASGHQARRPDTTSAAYLTIGLRRPGFYCTRSKVACFLVIQATDLLLCPCASYNPPTTA
ncbi:uncharacterized protein DFL_006389 [Arthrobotrys flagrans]|uniref:Uncharacterized protein n=1 Tax=Arthrobotrys flagrans TaxID=97331 RepID=A0A437A0Y8_ARTFL|nr:hypothetical protein DFL_006389 [Arthrobotrys flagrans]